jgi:hypothetical protein
MSDRNISHPAIDAAHFFGRVLEVGYETDISQCRTALLTRYEGSLSRMSDRFVQLPKTVDTLERSSAEEIDEPLPQLRRVASLLLDVGIDLPLLRLAGLISVASDKESTVDPWYVRRGIDATSRVSYVRRLYNEVGSEGRLALLGRTFLFDMRQASARLAQLVQPRISQADDDWVYIEGSLGPTGQVEIEAYWDGFVSVEIRTANASEFDDAAESLLGEIANLVPQSVANLGNSLLEAVAREGH